MYIFITWLRLVAIIMHTLIGQEQYQSRLFYNNNAYGLILDYTN